jgi:hypothetical protein
MKGDTMLMLLRKDKTQTEKSRYAYSKDKKGNVTVRYVPLLTTTVPPSEGDVAQALGAQVTERAKTSGTTMVLDRFNDGYTLAPPDAGFAGNIGGTLTLIGSLAIFLNGKWIEITDKYGRVIRTETDDDWSVKASIMADLAEQLRTAGLKNAYPLGAVGLSVLSTEAVKKGEEEIGIVASLGPVDLFGTKLFYGAGGRPRCASGCVIVGGREVYLDLYLRGGASYLRYAGAWVLIEEQDPRV